jgi:hypothetical protein
MRKRTVLIVAAAAAAAVAARAMQIAYYTGKINAAREIEQRFTDRFIDMQLSEIDDEYADLLSDEEDG